MKYVQASRVMYDASVGRVEPGETYYVEDDKAERWLIAGVATLTDAPRPAPPPPPPMPPDPEPIPPEPEPGDEEPESETPAELRAEVRRRFDSGQSERAVAEQLGIPRTRVHSLLRS